jgi:hypothetical protein
MLSPNIGRVVTEVFDNEADMAAKHGMLVGHGGYTILHYGRTKKGNQDIFLLVYTKG